MDTQSNQEAFDRLVEAAINAAQHYYHTETVVMTDLAYDALVEEIESLSVKNPDWDTRGVLLNVSAGTSSFLPTVKHKHPMLSLAKAKTIEEVEAFSTRVSSPLVYEVKLDGLAVSAIYRDGKLAQLLTRGDGFSGEDITAKKTLFKTLPKSIPALEEVELRGEVYMSDIDFLKTNEARVAIVGKAFLNPRNAVAGIIRSLSLEYPVAVSFAVYDAIFAESKFLRYSDSLVKVAEWGFSTASLLTPSYNATADSSEILSQIEAERPNLGFPIDGVVIKVDSIEKREEIGSVSNAPKWACAFKYAADTTTTELLDIEISVGRTGQMSLRAVLEPVYVSGTTITYATLHNPKFISDADIRIGDTVYVYRAGDVVPRVDAVEISKRKASSTVWLAPETCPQCGETWNKSSLLWRCETSTCSTIGRIEYALSRDALDVEGASSAVATALVESGKVETLSDIYSLSLSDLSNLELSKGRLLGSKNGQKILDNIEKTKTHSADKVFAALGIRTLGRTLSKRLVTEFPTLDAFSKISEEELASVEGIGKEKSKIIIKGIEEQRSVIEALIKFDVGMVVAEKKLADSSPLAGKVVVISGAIPGYTRDEANSLVESLGGKSSGSVSKNTSILVSGEGSGSKYEKAVSLGVAVWSPEKLLELV